MITSLPEELHLQAEALLQKPHTQANLRRSISANYYALFHMLIRDAILLWDNQAHHANLARQFEHKRMKEASSTLIRTLRPEITAIEKADPKSPEAKSLQSLLLVAQAFGDLQEARRKADYDINDSIPFDTAENYHVLATVAFEEWQHVRRHARAQDYLYSLLFKDREPLTR